MSSATSRDSKPDASQDPLSGEQATEADERPVTPDALLQEAARIAPAPTKRPSLPLLPPLAPGEQLGHFHIVSKLGEGGMGAVYEAEDGKLGRRIALKVLTSAGGDEQQRRFLREARSAGAVTHPNIAAVYEVGKDKGRAFIAMELVRGSTLRALLLGGKALPIPEALRIAREIARGLAKAHGEGIIHRDIKPDNVMVAPDGDVKLLDFGLAKRVDGADDAVTASSHERSGTEGARIVGTPAYMAPEQINGQSDARSDVFSFGVMLYEIVTGRRPFKLFDRTEPERPSHLEPKTPPEIERIVLRCLQREPSARYADAGELLRDLELPGSASPEVVGSALSSAEVIVVQGPEEPRPPETSAPRSVRGLGCQVVVAVLVLGIGVAGTYWALREPVPQRAPRVVPLASARPAASASAPTPPPPPAEPERIQHSVLSVSPADATVDVDGVRTEVRDGTIEIAGRPGSMHRVRVSKGANAHQEDVVVTEDGLRPPKVELPAPRGVAPAKSAVPAIPAGTVAPAAPEKVLMPPDPP